MLTPTAYIAHLIYRSLTNDLTEAEQLDLENWLALSHRNQQWYEHITEQEFLVKYPHRYDAEWQQSLKQELILRVNDKTGLSLQLTDYPEQHQARVAHRVHFLKTAWFRYAAAIILFIGIGITGYFVLIRDDRNAIVNNEKSTTPAPADNILPGSNKAILTLSDGRRVVLDSASPGTISDQNLSIENKYGQLKYGGSGLVGYNTMTTPRGGQYEVILPDGTKVWLNAASSITYPTAFTGNNRTVNIEGEAYFEVAKDVKKPFIVKTYQDEITVLGTVFNINAYSNEIQKTTLIEGKVKVGNVILHPGQAASRGTRIATNVLQDIAWKNGIFNFEGQDLRTIMRQIERWYGVQVTYKGNITNAVFAGEMDRGVKLSGVIRFLQQYGLTAELKGRELIVSQ